MLFLPNTSRVEGVEYDGLLREKGFGGGPMLAVMDAEGNVLDSPIPGTVSGFQGILTAPSRTRSSERGSRRGG